MYNDCTFIGNIGKDPEAHAAKGGSSFTTFSIAVNKPGADKETKPLWINVTTFGKTGEFAVKYLKQGNQVLVQGALELQEYEGKDGKNHTTVKLLAGKVVSLTKRDAGAAPAAAASAGASASAASSTTVSDEDIPF